MKSDTTTSNITPVVSLPMPFADDRGVIQTLVNGGIHAVQIISSKTGSVRANHYHRQDSHYMYVVSGKMRYIERPAESDLPATWTFVGAGQLVYTPSMVEHAVEFVEDTVFLNITGKSREQSDYEGDLVRVKLYPQE
jgi:oxalate decarboxylase/phosphoglucose isomerase-like protein (cupin superfamily)